MDDRFISARYLFILILVISVTSGCAGRIPPSRPADKALENMLANVSRRIAPDERILATGHMDLVTSRGHYPARTAWAVQKPSYLRLEVLPVIGTPDLILSATPEEMRIFLPSRAELYEGPPTADTMSQFLPWVFNMEDIVMIFSGDFPPLKGYPLSYEGYPEDSLFRVSMHVPAGESQTIWVDKSSHVVKLVRYGEDGRERYRVLWEDYAPSGRLAGKITLTMADQTASLAVKFTDVQIEKSTDLSVFELPVPAGVKTIKVN